MSEVSSNKAPANVIASAQLSPTCAVKLSTDGSLRFFLGASDRGEKVLVVALGGWETQALINLLHANSTKYQCVDRRKHPFATDG